MNAWALLVLLGTVQGLTEFLPVSSDGHLALAQMLFGGAPPSLAISVMLHAGTLIATLVYFRGRLQELVVDTWRALCAPSKFRELPGARDTLCVVIASFPTAIIGLGLQSTVERWTRAPEVVAAGFLVTAGVLLSTLPLSGKEPRAGGSARPSSAHRDWLPWSGALLLGIAQGIAVAPGVSRSGATIAAGLWLGLRAERAFDLSMLLSLPAVAGALLLEAPQMTGTGIPSSALLGGGVAAFLVGFCALAALRRVVIAGRLWWFSAWVLTVAIATFALARAWPAS